MSESNMKCGHCGGEEFALQMGERGESVIAECTRCASRTRIVGWEAGIAEAGTFRYVVQLRRHTGKMLRVPR
jgi:hypothetical protein